MHVQSWAKWPSTTDYRICGSENYEEARISVLLIVVPTILGILDDHRQPVVLPKDSVHRIYKGHPEPLPNLLQLVLQQHHIPRHRGNRGVELEQTGAAGAVVEVGAGRHVLDLDADEGGQGLVADPHDGDREVPVGLAHHVLGTGEHDHCPAHGKST